MEQVPEWMGMADVCSLWSLVKRWMEENVEGKVS